MPLTDPRAIEIISHARRPNVAKPRTTDRDFRRILEDFFPRRLHDTGFQGELIMDLGPGQFDFARLIRQCGGRCENIDIDPAVIELGTYLGEICHCVDMIHMDAKPFRNRFDGLFCKFSINALWFYDVASAGHLVDELDSMLKPGGWGWVVPWNGRPKKGFDDELAALMLAEQRRAFLNRGWSVYELSPEQAGYYGVSGAVENHPLFLNNLHAPKGLTR